MVNNIVDLPYAILAMDVYNRSTNEGVFLVDGVKPKEWNVEEGTELPKEGTIIGNYEVIKVSHRNEYTAQSFYAIAYKNVNTGEIIISYRGTDDVPGKMVDAFTGWAMGAGFVENNQAGLAIKFYEDVVKQVGGASIPQNFTIFDP